MGTVTLSCEADVATWSSGIAAGKGDHLPVGYWSSARYRSAMRFPIPAGWAGWTGITSAKLEFYISDHNHVGVRNSAIWCRRTPSASPWTLAEGSQDCESGYSGSNTTQYDDIAPVTTNQVSFTTGSTANAKKSLTVTAMVQGYWAYNQKPVFVFDPQDTDDYSEFWSKDKLSTYIPKLIITYEDAAPPSAPTLGAPAAGATTEDTTPNFSWTHNDPDAQSAADVELYDAAGTTLLHTYSVVGAANNVDGTDVLPRGLNYQWRARTYDAVSGVGAWSGLRTFTVRALPVVTIDATRRMVFANGAPRMVVQWSSDQPQTHYRVQATGGSGYDSGWVAGADVSHVLSTHPVVSGTSMTISVSTRSSYGALEGTANRAWTPRYGLTTHRLNLTSAPINWGSPVIDSIVPTDCQLPVEYGSDVAAIAAPSAWFSDLSAVPKKQYLFYRVWFIPSAVAGPTLNSIIIPTDSTVTAVDKWGTTRDVAALAGGSGWSIDPAESVYGTRSMTVDCDGTLRKVYAFKVKVKPNRSYILTGLMKSQGDSGAHFRLEDAAGNVLIGGGMIAPPGPVQSDILTGDKTWFDTSARDVNRYKTVIWLAPSEMDVYVVLAAQGASGAKAWFDAIKLEESTVATPWSPGAIGATVIDAGGVQVDASRGGVFRYKGSLNAARGFVEGGPTGLLFAGDTELTSPSDGVLAADGVPLLTALPAHVHDPAVIGGYYTGPTKTAIATTPLLCSLTNGGRIAGGVYVVGAGEAGAYWVGAAGVILALGSAAAFRIFIYKNGASIGSGQGGWNVVANNGAGVREFGVVDLAVGDTIGVWANGGSGTSGATMTPHLHIYRLGPSFA
jgi:hypothetical protein